MTRGDTPAALAEIHPLVTAAAVVVAAAHLAPDLVVVGEKNPAIQNCCLKHLAV